MSIEAYACKLKKKNGKDIAKILFQMCECVSNFIRNNQENLLKIIPFAVILNFPLFNTKTSTSIKLLKRKRIIILIILFGKIDIGFIIHFNSNNL